MDDARDPHPATVGPRRRRGRPSTLSRARIGDAAVAVGFVDLTVVAVAARLGVTHKALYGHVEDRDDLVLAAAERIADAVDWPPYEGGWRPLLEAEGFAMWDALIGHPGLKTALDAVGRLPLSLRERFGTTTQALLDLGFDAALAMLAVDLVYDLAIDASSRSASHGELDPDQMEAMAAELFEPLPEAVRAEFQTTLALGPRGWFATKLGVILDGIEARHPT